MRGFAKKFLNDRMRLLLVVFFVAGALFIVRLFYIQIINGDYYQAVASGQYKLDKEILQSRGEIYIHQDASKELAPLAINRKLNLVYAVPSEISNPRGTARALASVFEIDDELRSVLEDEIFNKVKKENDPYEPIWHRANDDQVAQVKANNLVGVYFTPEWERYYPLKEAASHVSGFYGHSTYKRKGQYGVEGYFQDELAGEKGKLLGSKDVSGRVIAVGDSQVKQAEDGADIILTLDKIVQTRAYEVIKEAVEGYGAEDGSIIVMNPQNGEIKALANYPSFDPNEYGEAESIEVFRNLAVSHVYEPGSIFKIITMGIGLDTSAVEVDDTYVDEGFIKFGRHKIRNADNEKFGEVNMTQILENSINTGAVHVALSCEKAKYYEYVKNFGFGDIFGKQFFGEAGGDISSLKKRGEIYLATASYGQGITVTPLQMTAAMATVVNGGKFVYPRLVDYIQESDGETSIITDDRAGKQVINAKTSNILKAMLVSVVKNGHGNQAQVPGYYIGGKTGTAEIVSPLGGGYSNENNHSFVGFGPLDDTRFVIMVKLTKPKWGRFSAVTAAPTFAKMAGFLLQYYQVPPEY